MGASPFSFILPDRWLVVNLLELSAVLEISNKESINDLLPECLLPSTRTGVLWNLRYDFASSNNSFHILYFLHYIYQNFNQFLPLYYHITSTSPKSHLFTLFPSSKRETVSSPSTYSPSQLTPSTSISISPLSSFSLAVWPHSRLFSLLPR